MQAHGDRVVRSGVITGTLLVTVLGAMGAFWVAHTRGSFHRLTTTQEKPDIAASPATPGGQEMIQLQRAPRGGSMEPEFTSALTLPGDGLMLLQAYLSIPGTGDVPVLLTSNSAALAGPVADIQGAGFSARVQSRQGSGWSDPVEVVAGSPSSFQTTEMLPDGSRAVAEFGSRPDTHTTGDSGVQITASVLLASRGIETGLVAKNVSSGDRAVTLSWLPRFAPPAGGIQKFRMLPPLVGERTLTHDGQRLPAVSEALREVNLGQGSIDRTYQPLRHGYLDQAPEVQIRSDAYTLRLTALTPSIQSLRVQKTDDEAILLGFSTAGNDGNGRDRGLPTVLHPGESLEWRVRLDAVANSTYTPPAP